MTVPERMLSLAIGREGQNARLAARLTGWRIDIRSDVSVAEAKAAREAAKPPDDGCADAVARRDRVAEPAAAKRSPRLTAAAETGRRRGGQAEAPEEPRAKKAATTQQPSRRDRAGDRRPRQDGATKAARRRRRHGEGRARRRRPPRRRPPRPKAPAAATAPRRRSRPTAAAAATKKARNEEGSRGAPTRRPRRSRRADRQRAAAGPDPVVRRLPDEPETSASSSGSSGPRTGRVTIDETGRLAGRGAYLCRDAGCWTTALERGALGRALEAPLPAELRESLLALATTMTMTDGGGARGQE